MDTSYNFLDWFPKNWPRVALPLAVVLLLLSPFLWAGLGLPGFLVFLLLPVYMIHQYEEHAKGRFKAEVEAMLPPSLGPVSNTVIFWVNIGLVWGVYLVLIYLTRYVALGLGLAAAYTTVVNALLHIIVAIRTRRYNAGLWTSLILFLPLGAYTIYALNLTGNVSGFDHTLGIGLALVVHVITFAWVINSARQSARKLA